MTAEVARTTGGPRDRRAAPGSLRTALVLLGLVALGLLLRGVRVTESLWYDEIAAWRDYGQRGPAEIVTTYADPANHVAHTLLTWCAHAALADAVGAEVALRAPALLFSLLAIPAMFGLGRAAGGRRVGLCAAAAAAIAPVCVLEGAEARGYSMMIACSAVASWRLLAALDTGRWRPAIEYALACGLGAWAHPMTVLVPAGHGAWLAWRWRRDRGERRRVAGGALAVAGAAALTLGLYAPIAVDVVRARARFAGADASGPPLLGPEGGHLLLQMGGSWTWWAALPGLALAGLGAAASLRDGRADRAVAVALAGLPVLLLAVVVTGIWTYARFALFALPGALLLVALGLDALWRRAPAAAAAALLVFAAAAAGDLALRPPKQPLRETAAWLAEHRGPDEPVLVVGLRHAVMDAYAGPATYEHSLRHGADLGVKLETHRPAWIVVLYPESVPPDRFSLLAAHGFAEVARFRGWVDWTNGDVVILRRGAPTADS